jgi:superfamily I DNA and/or RNA helicase
MESCGDCRSSTVEDFVTKMRHLIDLEHEAEKKESQQVLERTSDGVAASKGFVLLNLRVQDMDGGLLGKTLLTLSRNKGNENDDNPLPPHKFSQHDIVHIQPNKSEKGRQFRVEGVVYRLSDSTITISIDDFPDDDLIYVPLKVEKIANYLTYKRLSDTLTLLEKAHHENPVCAVLFERKRPSFNDSIDFIPLNKNLDSSQKEAVKKSLQAQELALIHGPPGTGKTTTLVEYISQEVIRGKRVLACTGSNIAIDNIVEGLSKVTLPSSKSIDVVRLGHPARLLPETLKFSLDYKVLHSDEAGLAQDCRKEIKQLNKRLLRLKSKDYEERRDIRREIRHLCKEERQRQKSAVDRALSNAHVISCTLSGAASFQLSKVPVFDVIVIDEAAQSTEPSCWGAILRGKKCVLAGDHLQLPPTILSDEAARKGLSNTMFERAQSLWGNEISQMLSVQYRMNAIIMQWSSDELYNSGVYAHHSVASHTLNGEGARTSVPVLLFIDTAGCNMEEQRDEDCDSLSNAEEAEIAMKHVETLCNSGIDTAKIGIITPYSAQVNLLRSLRNSMFGPELEISTVDGFQGREKDAIIISMVRSNTHNEVGFLKDCRRMNVAITRAKKHCAIIGDSETISSDKFLDRLVYYFQENGEYESAESYRL